MTLVSCVGAVEDNISQVDVFSQKSYQLSIQEWKIGKVVNNGICQWPKNP